METVQNTCNVLGGCSSLSHANHVSVIIVTMETCRASTASSFAKQVKLPHDLNCPLQVQTLLDDPPEHLLCLVLTPLQYQSIPDVVRIFYTCQLWDTRGAHYGEEVDDEVSITT